MINNSTYISLNETSSCHLKLLKTKKTTIYADEDTSPILEQAQISGWVQSHAW